MGVVSLKQAGVKEITSAHVQLLRKGESRGLPTPVLKSGESLGELSADSGATAPGFDFAGSSATANKGKAAATTTSTEQKQNTEVATTSTMTSGRPMLSDDIFAAYEQPPLRLQPRCQVAAGLMPPLWDRLPTMVLVVCLR